MKSDMSYKPIGLSSRGKAFGRGFGRTSSNPKKTSFRTIGLSTLSPEQRRLMKPSSFAIPEKAPGPGSYPIPDKAHARNALARAAQYGSPNVQRRVRAAVHRKFPSIGFDSRGGSFGRPDTDRGMQHTSMGEKVYGLNRRHPRNCQCPFHGGHKGNKGGVGFNLKGIGNKTFPTPRRATI